VETAFLLRAFGRVMICPPFPVITIRISSPRWPQSLQAGMPLAQNSCDNGSSHRNPGQFDQPCPLDRFSVPLLLAPLQWEHWEPIRADGERELTLTQQRGDPFATDRLHDERLLEAQDLSMTYHVQRAGEL
jgi:hypothetical protein